MTELVSVSCVPAVDGWSCTVKVGSTPDATLHTVSVSRDELRRYGQGATDPAPLVEASFAFLLEREPKESILRSFALSVIERYFPEFTMEIGGRT